MNGADRTEDEGRADAATTPVTTGKRLIFTVTPGRSGSYHLCELLSAVPDVHAEHEPEPNFVHVMRRTQHDPDTAARFLRAHKMPAINAVAEPVYAETSHLTCKGFIEPMIRMGLRPGLIFLRRAPREVAWSLLERSTVPGRSRLGCAYLLEPRDPYVLPLIGWEGLSDYQLCFWYALEIERRHQRYATLADKLGLATAEVTNTELNDWTLFSRLLTDLGLSATDSVREAHSRISKRRHNLNPVRREMNERDVAAAEQEVWDRVAAFEPLLPQEIQLRYASS